MKKSELKKIIKEELNTQPSNESKLLEDLVSLLGWYGIPKTKQIIIHQNNPELLAYYEKIIPQYQSFLNNVLPELQKIVEDPMFGLHHKLRIEGDLNGGGYGQVSIGDTLEGILNGY